MLHCSTISSYHAVGELLNVGEKAETLYIEDLPPNATIFSLNGNSIFVGLDGFYNCQVPVTKLAVNKGLIPVSEYKPEDADFYYIRKSNSNIFQKYIRPEEAGTVKDIYYYKESTYWKAIVHKKYNTSEKETIIKDNYMKNDFSFS